MFFLRDTRRVSENELSFQDVIHRHSTSAPSSRRSLENFTPSGVSSNARIKTARGLVTARELRIGDLVQTRDNGMQCLRWIGQSRHASENGALIRVLNHDGSRSQMLLAPDHLVLQVSPSAELMFGNHEVLCPAHGLLKSARFEVASTATPTLCHMLFDSFELIRAGDCWIESHVPDMPRTRDVAPDLADEIIAALPRLAHDQAMANYLQDRIVLDDREAKALCQLVATRSEVQ